MFHKSDTCAVRFPVQRCGQSKGGVEFGDRVVCRLCPLMRWGNPGTERLSSHGDPVRMQEHQERDCFQEEEPAEHMLLPRHRVSSPSSPTLVECVKLEVSPDPSHGRGLWPSKGEFWCQTHSGREAAREPKKSKPCRCMTFSQPQLRHNPLRRRRQLKSPHHRDRCKPHYMTKGAFISPVDKHYTPDYVMYTQNKPASMLVKASPSADLAERCLCRSDVSANQNRGQSPDSHTGPCRWTKEAKPSRPLYRINDVAH